MSRKLRVKRLRLLSLKRISKSAKIRKLSAMWRQKVLSPEGQVAKYKWENSEPIRFFVDTDAGTILVEGEGFGGVDGFAYTIEFSAATDDAIDKILQPLRFFQSYETASENIGNLAVADTVGSINFTNFRDSEDGALGFFSEWLEWNRQITMAKDEIAGVTPGKKLREHAEGPAGEGTEHQSPLGEPIEGIYMSPAEKDYVCREMEEYGEELPEWCEGVEL